MPGPLRLGQIHFDGWWTNARAFAVARRHHRRAINASRGRVSGSPVASISEHVLRASKCWDKQYIGKDVRSSSPSRDLNVEVRRPNTLAAAVVKWTVFRVVHVHLQK